MLLFLSFPIGRFGVSPREEDLLFRHLNLDLVRFLGIFLMPCFRLFGHQPLSTNNELHAIMYISDRWNSKGRA